MRADYYGLAKRRGGYGILAVTLPRNPDGSINHKRRSTQAWTGEVFPSQAQAEDVIAQRNGCRQ